MMVLSMLPISALAVEDEQEVTLIPETLVREEEKVGEEQNTIENSEKEQILQTQDTADAVTYLSPVYKEAGKPESGLKEMETKTCTDYTVLTKSMTTLASGWYVLSSDVAFFSDVTVSGDVKIILCDEKKITVCNLSEIIVNSGNSLTIYGQKNGTGEIENFGTRGFDAAIGGQKGQKNGRIEINGGKINVESDGSAAIGGGYDASGQDIIINGGTITAKSDDGAGIGGGYENKAKTIYFENCHVIAVGGSGNGRGDGVGSAKKGGKSSDIKISTAEPKLDLFFNDNLKDYGSGDLADMFSEETFVRIQRTDSASFEDGHEWQFRAEGAIIKAECQNENIHESCSPEFVELLEPENLLYDGEKKEVRINGFIDGVELPPVQYYQGETLLTDAPSEIGSYTAKLTLDDATAEITFDIVGQEDTPTQDEPKTTDSTTPNTGISCSTNTLWIAIMLLAATMVCVFAISCCKNRVNR